MQAIFWPNFIFQGLTWKVIFPAGAKKLFINITIPDVILKKWMEEKLWWKPSKDPMTLNLKKCHPPESKWDKRLFPIKDSKMSWVKMIVYVSGWKTFGNAQGICSWNLDQTYRLLLWVRGNATGWFYKLFQNMTCYGHYDTGFSSIPQNFTAYLFG